MLLEERAPKVVRSLLDLLYPPRCGGCGRFGAGWWCAACDKQTACLSGEHALSTRQTDASHTVQIISACAFQEPLQSAIHRFKYEGQPQLHTALSAHMIRAWQSHSKPDDILVPVPLHTGRKRERGFNQSELLARDVATATHAPMSTKLLSRTRNTDQQAHLAMLERKANVRGAFVAQGNLVRGKRIVLVDDVLTTGATLCECVDALYVAGASDVVALTLARA